MTVAVADQEPIPAAAGGEVLPTIGQPVGGGGWRSHLGSLLFLLPGVLWLAVIVVYPFIATIVRSLYDGSGTNFIALGNYKDIFSTSDIVVSLKNNVVWVVVFPFFVTFFGLVFAVLTERIRWGTAFKTIVFMPLVFSATAAGLTWASIFFNDPHTGLVNAAVQGVSNAVSPPGLYPVDTSAGQAVSSLAAANVRSGAGGVLREQVHGHRRQHDRDGVDRHQPCGSAGGGRRRRRGARHQIGRGDRARLARLLPDASDGAWPGLP